MQQGNLQLYFLDILFVSFVILFHITPIYDFQRTPGRNKTNDLNRIFALSLGPAKREEGESSLL